MSALPMRMLRIRCRLRHRKDCTTCFVKRRRAKYPVSAVFRSSGFPSARINLSTFTKDFRGGEQLNESID